MEECSLKTAPEGDDEWGRESAWMALKEMDCQKRIKSIRIV
jgi:hypothetical protein